METSVHTFSSLFEQLGLDESDQAIESFIQNHSPLAKGVELHEAEFLRQAKADDADWAELVDQLSVALRAQ